jgi:putative transposase
VRRTTQRQRDHCENPAIQLLPQSAASAKRQSSTFYHFLDLWTLALPPKARDLVLEHCVGEQGRRAEVHCVVVMPDHVHMVLTARRDEEGPITLGEIMSGIKSASAHSINRAFKRSGRVWQKEFFDHVLRRN